MEKIKAAKKRIITSQKNADRNKAIRSKVKTFVKKVDAAIAEGDKDAAVKALEEATSVINKAASKGVYHKNTASRKVSILTIAVNKMN